MNLYVFTDGATSENGKENAVGGIGVHFTTENIKEQLDIKDICERYSDPNHTVTNNRCELLAILRAFESIYKQKLYKQYDSICIYSDSNLCVQSLNEWILKWKKCNWKTASNTPVKNQDLIKPIDSYRALCPNVLLKHCRAHQKEPKDKKGWNWFLWYNNALVDSLAVDGKTEYIMPS